MKQLLLAGGGHSHALLLRHWVQHPQRRPPQTAISLVSRQGAALYSGLVPAVIAAALPPEAAAIDLRALCRAAGVTFVQAEISGVDPRGRQLMLELPAGQEPRPPLAYDMLSLNVGAAVALAPEAAATALPIKPLEPLLAALERLPVGAAVAVVGSGAAAVEVSLALAARGFLVSLQALPKARPFWGRFLPSLEAAGVRLQAGPESHELEIHCTGSLAPAWLQASGWALDGRGRLLTNDRLQCLGDPLVFGAGDCAVVQGQARPASGVWAVRAAPLLAHNLAQARQGLPLRRWKPQRRALQLLGDGAGGAYALWGPFCWGPSAWIWRWKQRLDQRFMAMLAPGAMAADRDTTTAMACSGCAAKLPAAPLLAALGKLAPLKAAEDAPVMGASNDGGSWLQSLDGFPALVDDPWLNGRLTALHACSDLWASGAQVCSAQALVNLPRLNPALQANLLLQTLAGVRSVLAPLGAELLGGHSLQAPQAPPAGQPLARELLLALVVNGLCPAGVAPWGKGPLRRGQVLLLSRSVGSGVLFAGAMAGAARQSWLAAALGQMQQCQAALVPLLAAHGCQACTDVTGFGLLGHLNEMLAASSGVAVQLEAQAVPAMAGALSLLEQGYASSLAPANAAALVHWPALGGVRAQLLIDPQTCGPLLAAVPADRAAACLAAMVRAGFSQAALVGRVVAAATG